MEGEGDSSINLAEAGAHVLLEALHVHCQQGGAPAHPPTALSVSQHTFRSRVTQHLLARLHV